MRMLKGIFTVCLLSLIVMACEGPMGPPGRDGLDGWDGRDGEIEKYYVSVKSNEWNYNPVSKLYFKKFNFVEIDKFIIDDGLVLVYWEDLTNINDIIKWPLPFTKRIVNGVQEFYQFDYRVGELTIYMEPSDFNTDYTPPAADFEVAIVWLDPLGP